MGLRTLIAHALGRGTNTERPKAGQVVRPMAADRWRDYPADGLTPGRLVQILRTQVAENCAEPAARQ